MFHSGHYQRSIDLRHIRTHAPSHRHAHPWLAQALWVLHRHQRHLFHHLGSVSVDSHVADQGAPVTHLEHPDLTNAGSDADSCMFPPSPPCRHSNRL